jgi:hypothetical protein
MLDTLPGLGASLRTDQGTLAISTELSAANTHITTSLRPRGMSPSLRSHRSSRIARLAMFERPPSVSNGTCPNGSCAKGCQVLGARG